MNTLSWLLYWADVLPSLARGMGVIFGLLSGACFFVTILYVTAGFGEWYREPEYLKRYSFAPYVFIISVILALTTNFIPSKQTFYLIAASEAGEQVFKTETGKKLIGAVNRTLDEIGSTKVGRDEPKSD